MEIFTIANADNTKIIGDVFQSEFLELLYEKKIVVSALSNNEKLQPKVKSKGNSSDYRLKSNYYLPNLKKYLIEFISDEVFLNGDENEKNPQTVFYKDKTFYSISAIDGKVREFRCLKQPSQLTNEEKENVLSYSIGHLTGKVDLRDIFLEGSFIKEM